MFDHQARYPHNSFKSGLREEGGFVRLELPEELTDLPVGCMEYLPF